MLVFLDASVIKHSAATFRTTEIIFGQTRAWHLHSGSFHFDPKIRNKKPAIGERLLQDIEVLPKLAKQISDRNVRLITDDEVLHELFQQNRAGLRRDFFFGMPIDLSEPPIEYARSLTYSRLLPNGLTSNAQINFLRGIEHPRFLSLQRATGAYQGTMIANNELKDAFFIWAAEHNSADYFLTTDYDLIECVERCKSITVRTKLITPTDLMGILLET